MARRSRRDEGGKEKAERCGRASRSGDGRQEDRGTGMDGKKGKKRVEEQHYSKTEAAAYGVDGNRCSAWNQDACATP